MFYGRILCLAKTLIPIEIQSKSPIRGGLRLRLLGQDIWRVLERWTVPVGAAPRPAVLLYVPLLKSKLLARNLIIAKWEPLQLVSYSIFFSLSLSFAFCTFARNGFTPCLIIHFFIYFFPAQKLIIDWFYFIFTVDNGLNPFWNETFIFETQCPQLAFLRFVVKNEDVFERTQFRAQATYPLTTIRTGYRSVYLLNGFSEPLDISALLVHVEINVLSNETSQQLSTEKFKNSHRLSIDKNTTKSSLSSLASAPTASAPSNDYEEMLNKPLL